LHKRAVAEIVAQRPIA